MGAEGVNSVPAGNNGFNGGMAVDEQSVSHMLNLQNEAQLAENEILGGPETLVAQ